MYTKEQQELFDYLYNLTAKDEKYPFLANVFNDLYVMHTKEVINELKNQFGCTQKQTKEVVEDLFNEFRD